MTEAGESSLAMNEIKEPLIVYAFVFSNLGYTTVGRVVCSVAPFEGFLVTTGIPLHVQGPPTGSHLMTKGGT